MKSLFVITCICFFCYQQCMAKIKDHCTSCLSGKCHANEEMLCKCPGGKTVKMNNKGEITYPKATVSLGFAVDVSGSMRSAITNIKNNIKAIVVQNAHDAIFNKFVLVSYLDMQWTNSKGYGSNRSDLVETDVDNIKAWINKVKVNGGGDCEEDAMWGIHRTAELVSRGSVILLYTDAGAKDYHLENKVIALLKKKDIRLVVINSGNLCGDASKGALALVRVTQKANGKLYNTSRSADDVLKYIQNVMPLGLAFIRTMPKSMEDLKTAAGTSCNCNTKLVGAVKCISIFDPTNKKVDGKLLKWRREATFSSDEFANNDLNARLTDLDTDTFVYYTSPKSDSLWLVLDLGSSEVLHSVYLVRRILRWASGDKEAREFRKYSIGLTSDSSVKKRFDWSKFRRCGSRFEGPPIGKQEWVMFVCGLSARYRYLSVYKEPISGLPNKMILTDVVVYKKDSAGQKQLMDISGKTSANGYGNIIDGKRDTFMQFGMEPIDHWLMADTGAMQVITKIIVYRRQGDDVARKNFNSISAGISNLGKDMLFDSRNFYKCGSMYKGRPPSTREFSISFYCNLEKKSRFVALLKKALHSHGNTFEISELQVYEYDPKA